MWSRGLLRRLSEPEVGIRFFRYYGAGYSRSVDVRMSRFVLEGLRVRIRNLPGLHLSAEEEGLMSVSADVAAGDQRRQSPVLSVHKMVH